MQRDILLRTFLNSMRPAIVCGIVLTSLAGCGRTVEPWGRVSGVVLQHGEPAELAIVAFVNREKGVEITAPTDAKGHFAIKTDKFPGLPVGDYKVVVTPAPPKVPLPADGMTFRNPLPPPPVSKIPQSYQGLATTKLTATVQEGRNDFNFDLK